MDDRPISPDWLAAQPPGGDTDAGSDPTPAAGPPGSINQRWQPELLSPHGATENTTSLDMFAAKARHRPLLFREDELDWALEAIVPAIRDDAVQAAVTAEMVAQHGMLEQIAAAIAQNETSQREFIGETARELIGAFADAIESMRSGLEGQILFHSLEPLILQHLERSSQAEAIEIRIAPDRAAWLESKLAEAGAAAGINQALTIKGETGLAPGRAELHWQCGHAVCGADGVVDAVLQTLRSWIGEPGPSGIADPEADEPETDILPAPGPLQAHQDEPDDSSQLDDERVTLGQNDE
ncbi:MAG: hypothetical protein AAFY56_07120 [Pseudomonadota bacterium]